MQLTRFTDLGLRVLMYLSQPERADPVTNAEIAAQFQVPHNHIIKVVTRLAKLGWVSTTRGRNGGLRLGVSPASLRLGSIVRELEANDQLVNCDEPPCVLRGSCLVKSALAAGVASFYAKLDEYTLADVCAQRTGAALITLHRKYVAAHR
jgi:Rrf2 family nitric oxide-sensitive transcriptional repressor